MNNVFLKIDGLMGESKDSTHQGWSDAETYSWGVRRKGQTAGPGVTNYHHLTVHCQVDKATAGALLYASNGNKIKKIELSACKSGGNQKEYYRITLESVIIMEVLFNDGGSITNVEYEFQADKVKFQYWEQGNSGGKAAETRMGWNIKESESYF
ncbi:Hcp family type VI secretion system effector [Pantoea cypripedii]|uniref:Hcp1 family type VI secretion system effector n=1 Tax=Pantoea cypripedii TaxID=55209 RepID=A0A6B9G1E4_PANCY|nr:type VI secretion system tube protein Hcp [Pantoea cypripedii]QGY28410.1 Hcp1 family type VI secretion system effector [Pantoea cypripedii]